MNNDSRAAAGKLKKEHDRIRYTAYLMIGIVIAVILVSAFRKFWLTLIFIAAALFIQLFVFRRMQKQYVEHAVEENLRAAVCPILNTDRVAAKGEELLSKEVIRETQLVPVMEQSGAVNIFTGISGYTGTGQKRMEVTTCDVALTKHQPGTKVSAEILCGNWIHIGLPVKTGYHFLVQENKVRSVTAHDENEGEPVPEEPLRLPDRFYSQLEKLEDYTTGSLSMTVNDDTADIFLKDRFLAANFSARSEVTEKMIDWNPLPELEKVLDLVWTLT